jgi:poly(hydroxyalkanoate) depolymerase family esterase
MIGWLLRLRDVVRRLFRREIPPGRFEPGTAGSWHGWVASAPLVLPRRDYLAYLPSGYSRWRRWPMLVLCHGCKQSPEDIAAATRITAFADAKGWIVLLPRQKESANSWSCWNWFDGRTAHGAGEAAILLAQIEDVVDTYRGDRERVVVAGMSAGGALAAAFALRHAARVRGAFVHSGLACGAASTPGAAMNVMRRGPDADVEAIAREVRSRSAGLTAMPLCVVHGEADDVVANVNAAALVRQFLRLNEHPALARPLPPGTPQATTLPAADVETREALPGTRVVTTREWRNGERLVVRYVSIAELGHAWSGGDPAYPFNDPASPPATDALARFVTEVTS